MTMMLAIMGGLLAAVLLLLLIPTFREVGKLENTLTAIMIIAASIALYGLWGAPYLVPKVMAYQARVEELRAQIETTSAVIKQNPKNLEAWLTLAQAFSDSGDYKAAADGFKQAVVLSKGHPRIITAYAEALIMQAEGSVTPAAKKSLDIALMMDPKLPLARYYNAVWMLQQNRQEEAMAQMKALYRELPDDSSLKKRMNENIGR